MEVTTTNHKYTHLVEYLGNQKESEIIKYPGLDDWNGSETTIYSNHWISCKIVQISALLMYQKGRDANQH